MKKRLIKRIIFPSIAFFVGFLITLTHVAAQEVPFYWDSLNVNIDVQTNGDMLITERQKYVFKADYTNQRFRYIPLDKVDEIREVTVQENDQTIPSQTGIENNQFWIRWKHELKPPQVHTFVLKYRVVGGLHVDDQNTQVYWKAIFADRKAPIQAATVQVQLPESLSGKVLSFTNFGASAIARQVNPTTFEFVANQSIQPEQELEVQITFPSDILNVSQPKWQQGNFFNFNSWIFVVFFLPFPIICLANFMKNRRCPQCKTFNLKRTQEILVPATTSHSGRRRMICHCENCSYHHEYEENIPVISNDGGGGGGNNYGGYGGSDYGGGGYDGGGGGYDGGGGGYGGGGGCDGGGGGGGG
ncbi:DUF2207 domain-containing protein [Scytonema tolypothrichoides VB-61278]|nr:DUF2207 domain-containing protein [Scytonema tolypothrichoides VB-61278]